MNFAEIEDRCCLWIKYFFVPTQFQATLAVSILATFAVQIRTRSLRRIWRLTCADVTAGNVFTGTLSCIKAIRAYVQAWSLITDLEIPCVGENAVVMLMKSVAIRHSLLDTTVCGISLLTPQKKFGNFFDPCFLFNNYVSCMKSITNLDILLSNDTTLK